MTQGTVMPAPVVVRLNLSNKGYISFVKNCIFTERMIA